MESPEHNHRLDWHVWQDCITTTCSRCSSCYACLKYAVRRNISNKSIMPGGALRMRTAADSKACLHEAGSHLDGHQKRPLRERRRPVPYWEGQGQQKASLSFIYGPASKPRQQCTISRCCRAELHWLKVY